MELIVHFVLSSGGHPGSFLNTDDAGESTLLLPGDRANVTLHRFFRFAYVLAHVTRLPARVAHGRVTAPDAERYVWEEVVPVVSPTVTAHARAAGTR